MSVLLADTDVTHLQRLYEVFKQKGDGVVVTDNGTRAAQYILDRHFSLIFVDVELPGRDGFELLEQAKKSKPDVPVILMSRNGGVDAAVRAIKLGAADFLTKPVPEELVVEIIAAYLDRGDEAEDTEISDKSLVRPIVTVNPKMEKLLVIAKKIAPSQVTVLIQGESGTGKELLARYIHRESNRKKKPFVAINCAALPENLLESELFGYEKGAFTGAIARRVGKFELANGGTLLLDEISEIPLNLQAKLLRVLQESEIDRVGGAHPIPIDVRVIATTNVDLDNAVEKKKFRKDLYYRLNVINLELPPLKDRKDDILPLCHFFLKKFNRLNGTHVEGLSKEAEEILLEHDWEGNVRELENVIHRGVLLTAGSLITPESLVLKKARNKAVGDVPLVPLREMEKILIGRALKKTMGNRTRAAKVLGISVRTLRNKLNEYKNNNELIGMPFAQR